MRLSGNWSNSFCCPFSRRARSLAQQEFTSNCCQQQTFCSTSKGRCKPWRPQRVMRFCCTNSGDGSKVHLRLLGCSAFAAAWLFLSFTWLRQFCLGGSHQFQVQALQPCSGQSNRTSFIDSSMMGYQCYGPSGRDACLICLLSQASTRVLRPCTRQNFQTSLCCLFAVFWLCICAEPTEAVILSIYEGLQPRQVGAIRNNRAAYAERHGYRQVPYGCGRKYSFLAAANKLGALQILRIQLPTRPHKRSLLEQDSFSFAGSTLQSICHGARFRYGSKVLVLVKLACSMLRDSYQLASRTDLNSCFVCRCCHSEL